jgi:collagenase-like PrtC family protease
MGGGRAVKLSLGPVLFAWPAEAWRDFYFRIADEACVDTVHLGEVVCLKRAGLHAPMMEAVRERLARGGKEVVLSSLALIMNEAELDAVRALAGCDDALIEANDMAACALLAGRPHAIGPYVNVYNEGTLAYLAGRGAVRACLPFELPAASLKAIAAASPIELEVQVFGRVPLALSARCYAARARGRAKDDCRLVCREDGDGLAVDTLDGGAFLAINGTQTLSSTCANLVAEVGELTAMGIRRLRLSPHAVDMAGVADVFRAVAEGRLDGAEADARLTPLAGGMPFANGFFHGAAGAAFIDGE